MPDEFDDVIDPKDPNEPKEIVDGEEEVEDGMGDTDSEEDDAM